MSKALGQRISGLIAGNGGWIPFDEFMREALYAPDLGYYESAEVFGAKGDFITGVEIGPWLGLGLADLIEWGWQQLGSPAGWTLVEQGGGAGRLMCDVLGELAKRDMCMPSAIHAIERSAHMAARQQLAYAGLGVAVQMHQGLEELAAGENVLFFCNELPDAFPVRSFVWRDGVMLERGVSVNADGQFIWQEGEFSDAADLPFVDADVLARWPEGYVSEWNPNLVQWQNDVSRIMQRGFLFCVDYGFAQSEYYRAQRTQGTLLGHLGHEPVTDVLTDPGSRDITAHIDFTTLGRVGCRAGFNMPCWTTQGAWLAQSPSVQRYIQQVAVQGTKESMALMAEAKRMLLPQGMGELFKLSIQCKGIEAAAPDFLPSFNRVAALAIGDV